MYALAPAWPPFLSATVAVTGTALDCSPAAAWIQPLYPNIYPTAAIATVTTTSVASAAVSHAAVSYIALSFCCLLTYPV